MKELRIEEQKSICGGAKFWFEDFTANCSYYDTDFQALKQRQLDLISRGHAVSGIESY